MTPSLCVHTETENSLGLFLQDTNAIMRAPLSGPLLTVITLKRLSLWGLELPYMDFRETHLVHNNTQTICPPRRWERDLIWNKGLHRCNSTKDLEMISSWIFRVGPKFRQRHRVTSNEKAEAETGVMCLQTKGHRGLLAATRSRKRQGRVFPQIL